jgi:acetylornithine aminotransferase
VVERGNVLARLLSALAVELEPVVREVRGRGLMWGIEVAAMVGPVVQRLREEGLLTVPAGAHVIRLLPPLTVSRDEIGRAVEILRSVLAEPLG